MEAFGLLLHGFTVLLTWKTLALMMVGLILGIFGIPFLMGTILFGSIAIMTVCGKFCVRAIGNQGEMFMGVGPLGYRKKFRWDQIKGISVKLRRGSNDSVSQQIIIDADTQISIPNVPDSRVDYFVGALKKLRRDFFPSAPVSAIPPRIAEVA